MGGLCCVVEGVFVCASVHVLLHITVHTLHTPTPPLHTPADIAEHEQRQQKRAAALQEQRAQREARAAILRADAERRFLAAQKARDEELGAAIAAHETRAEAALAAQRAQRREMWAALRASWDADVDAKQRVAREVQAGATQEAQALRMLVEVRYYPEGGGVSGVDVFCVLCFVFVFVFVLCW